MKIPIPPILSLLSGDSRGKAVRNELRIVHLVFLVIQKIVTALTIIVIPHISLFKGDSRFHTLMLSFYGRGV